MPWTLRPDRVTPDARVLIGGKAFRRPARIQQTDDATALRARIGLEVCRKASSLAIDEDAAFANLKTQCD